MARQAGAGPARMACGGCLVTGEGQAGCAQDVLDLVQVDRLLGEAAGVRLAAMDLPCRPVAISTATMCFAVPAGTDTFPWPAPVTYLSSDGRPLTAQDAANGHASSAYCAEVIPPWALWAVLNALAAEHPGANRARPASAAPPGTPTTARRTPPPRRPGIPLSACRVPYQRQRPQARPESGAPS